MFTEFMLEVSLILHKNIYSVAIIIPEDNSSFKNEANHKMFVKLMLEVSLFLCTNSFATHKLFYSFAQTILPRGLEMFYSL